MITAPSLEPRNVASQCPTRQLPSRFKYAQGWIPEKDSSSVPQLVPPPAPSPPPPLKSLNQHMMPGARALLAWDFSEGLDHECPSLSSSAHRMCQGAVSTHSCFLRQGGSRWQEGAGEGAKPREPLGEAPGQRLSSPGSRTRRSGVPPKPPASLSSLSDQLMLQRTLYLTSCCGNCGGIPI